MNLRWVTTRAGAAVAAGSVGLLALSGCATSGDDSTASGISFSPVAQAASGSAGAPARSAATGGAGDVPVASPGTVCGSVNTANGPASVVVKSGHANCVDALRVGKAYAAAASNAQGQAVTVESAGWRCAARVTDAVATCSNGENAFTVG
ncbi:Secreted protein OS=Tsukamurella paurometabola (strain ATCC 8368 / DSM / CCUG 35730 / CIP 100753/ JCM 10117 / KCTC 9821 / NBRC 16120 / NCIMB 702349 / NCTC 13040) OX=521096 GN=Tpau_2147 PE=4 SV=1 [Tsukamurella paurometabola]|uniref:Secreted protein n=1 Tax=Tsukamurella paurometabola (strain ATCC 8368 / DSM 20162 / CCUG 35730 / CIP 100753 / JCM 10117 / KCTC 9821 / NBRC 16120 / NCIMB 702349 / NCTC 13040) TaxID=521096 RepID=D5UPK2_TSUPD|nr:hypothetical protein [Tsukamurella paurometabola]ADG78758.1 hypothetical protein Tpau_2147 [Tsukamurella paurometabola DSM 20162]SUP33047.1 Uncharacterised protein [Tsukamurella paurometabola]